jgi:hypothetical protein
MAVIIRMSKTFLKAWEKQKTHERLRLDGGVYVWRPAPDSIPADGQWIADTLDLGGGSFTLGNFVQSTITRAPIVRPIYFDAPPTDAEVWQQLSVMAAQYDACVNPANEAF